MTRALAITQREAPSRRVRASEAAIKAALRAIQDSGIPVVKVCVSGGQVEIHCGPVEGGKRTENDEGLKEW